jgi:ribosomal subunit interface protein
VAFASFDRGMQLLQITFHGLEHSNAVERYVRARAAKLDRFDPRIIRCRVALEKPHRHASHGEHYRVRVDLTVPGGEIVVERLPESDHLYEDLYAAIDAAFDDAGRRVEDFVRRRRGDVKAHTRARQ